MQLAVRPVRDRFSLSGVAGIVDDDETKTERAFRYALSEKGIETSEEHGPPIPGADTDSDAIRRSRRATILVRRIGFHARPTPKTGPIRPTNRLTSKHPPGKCQRGMYPSQT